MAYALFRQLSKCVLVFFVVVTQLQIAPSTADKITADFGRPMRDEFLLKPGYINLNHGAYGTYPRFVRTALHEFQDRAEANADLWIRREARPALDSVRRELAQVVNCEAEDLVVIPNTTSGMNAVLRSMFYAAGDKILHFSNIYNAMRSLIQFASDYSKGNVTALEFNVQWPMNNTELVTRFGQFVAANSPGIKLALIDHISSTPAIVQPLKQIIAILRAHNIAVLIDGAHAIGQVHVNLTDLQPDYYITNAHKWLYSPRGSAMMYVKKSLQATVHSASVSSNYSPAGTRFQDEFFWTGTIDFSPYMAIPAALEFRRQLGGEEVIRNYNHNLAIEGARYLTGRFNTRRMQVEDGQIGSMVDVELPIEDPDNPIMDDNFWINTLLYRYPNLYASPYKHNGAWWIRISAQIYTDMSDFVVAGDVFGRICEEINSGRTIPPEPTTDTTGDEPAPAGAINIKANWFLFTFVIFRFIKLLS